ncbi:hypothetical protein ACO2Q0_17595 [Phenylobacterium sp. VNQ135]|uniref:hypothetical protein n=1 Tax=Phenylobacterium sp. VNQ135 TaxID=3400922 RepID=UPI003C016993
MSSISSTAPFTPGYNPHAIQAQQSRKADQAAEKAQQKVAELTATAVAAESVKDSKKGGLLDISV